MNKIILLSTVIGVFCIAYCDSRAADPDPAVLQAQSQRIATIEKAKPSVLSIFESSGRGGGSGVVISSDGYALTNFHVVQPCGAAMKCGMADGRIYDAVLVGLDPTGDVALIKLLGRDDFPSAEMADSDLVHTADSVFAMGNPFLLSTNLQPTVTAGIISGVSSLSVPLRHAFGIHRLSANRCFDQSWQFRRPAFRRPRTVDRHQRALFFRQTRPRQRGRGLCDFNQPDQKFYRRSEKAAA